MKNLSISDCQALKHGDIIAMNDEKTLTDPVFAGVCPGKSSAGKDHPSAFKCL